MQKRASCHDWNNYWVRDGEPLTLNTESVKKGRSWSEAPQRSFHHENGNY